METGCCLLPFLRRDLMLVDLRGIVKQMMLKDSFSFINMEIFLF